VRNVAFGEISLLNNVTVKKKNNKYAVFNIVTFFDKIVNTIVDCSAYIFEESALKFEIIKNNRVNNINILAN